MGCTVWKVWNELSVFKNQERKYCVGVKIIYSVDWIYNLFIKRYSNSISILQL